MNNLKLLSAAVLLVLAKSAFAIIEVEPNNNSTLAATLVLKGIENVGQLSNGNDVDFYSIDASEDISLTFACNSRAIAQNNNQYGWYLTIHDDKGELQSSYQVLAEECVTGTTTAKGPYNFRIPKLASKTKETNKTEDTNEKYFLSVVGDCRRPVFNVEKNSSILINDIEKLNIDIKEEKNETKLLELKDELAKKETELKNNPLLSVNTFDKPATKSDIKKAQDAFDNLKSNLETVQKWYGELDKILAPFGAKYKVDMAIIDPNIMIGQSSDENVKKMKLPQIDPYQTVYAINTNNYINDITEILDSAVLNVASKAQLNSVLSTAYSINPLLYALTLSLKEKSEKITSATNKVVDSAAKIPLNSDAKKEDVDELIAAIKQFNDDVKIDNLNQQIDNLNLTVENLNTTVATAQDICTTGNTANYTIKDNPDTGITPYKESNIKNNLTVLGKENSGQNGSVSDVDFFEIAGSQSSIFPVKFSCAKSNAKGNTQGWVISAWQTNENDQGQWKLDKPSFVYQVSPADCNAPEVYTMDLKPYEKNYIIGVQSACALPPVNTDTDLRSSIYRAFYDPTDLDYLCDVNTANFTLKRDLKTATPLVVDVPKTGEMSSRSDYDLFVIENDQVSEYVTNLSCSQTIPANEDKPIWKLSVYDDSDKLVPNYPQFIKASDCNKNAKPITLPNGAIRSYIALEAALPLDTSKYTITKTIKKVETVNTPEPEKLTGTDGASVLLSAIEKGKITKTADTFNYYVDGSSLKETQLSFSCNSPEILFGNNWKVSVYQSDRTLKDTHIINSSDCVPDKTTGQSAYTITLPKEAARFYLQVKSTCEDTNCKIDQSEFEIMRKIETVVSNTDDTPTTVTPAVRFTPFTNIETKKISVLDKLFKKRIKKADEIHFYSLESSLEKEIFVQFACDKNAIATGWTIGIWEYDVENPQNAGWLYEKQTVLPAACIKDKIKIAIPSNSSAHLVSVQSSCLAMPADSETAINLEQAKICNVNTNNYILEKGTVSTPVETETPVVETPVTPPVVTVVDPIISALKTAKKIGTSQSNQIKLTADIQTYYVDAGVQPAANFEFSCLNSNRFTNDWILLTYDSAKKLQSTKIINGSDCGIGQIGDAGTFKFSALSNSPRTYFVVKSACEKDDSVCEVDTSKYTISRIIPNAAPTMNNGSTSTITAPCFSSLCETSSGDTPIFGGN